MKLLVLGASGGVGRNVVSQGVQRGHTLRALYRATTSADGVPEGVEIVRGDLMADDFLDSSMPGVDAVISCLGMRRRSTMNPWSALVSPEDFNSASAQRIVSAMKAASVARIAAVSAAGVAESAPNMNLVMRMLVARSNIGVAYRDLAVMERVYAQSGLDWLCPRPVTLTDGPRKGAVRVVDRFGMTMSISRADVAGYLLDWVEGEVAPTERTPQIAG